MTRRRLALLIVTVVGSAFTFAPNALAEAYNGEGIWGSSNPTQQTYAMLIVMCLFVAVIVAFSLLQAWLDHRKHARMDAAKHRESSSDWKGGW